MDWKNVILAIVLIANIALVFFTYFKGQKNKVNSSWTILIWAVIFWILSMFFYRGAGESASFIWVRILYVAACFIPVSFLYFSFIFPTGEMPRRKIYKILPLFAPAVIIFLVVFSDTIVKGVVIRPGQEKEILWGGGYFLYALYFFGFFGWALRNLFYKYIKAEGILRSQLRYMLAGTGLSAMLGTNFNLFLPWIGEFRFNWLGQVTTLFMIISISYAISRYHLLDVKMLLTEFFVFLIAFVLLIEVVLADSLYKIILRIGIFLLYCFFGYMLIKSVLNEIKRRQELEELNREKSEFISIASHQLRTPLTAIKGYVSLVLEGMYGALNDETRKVLDRVYKSNERLIELINHLLNISRIDAGKLELNLQESQLEDIILDIVQELDIESKKKNLYLKWSAPGIPLPRIRLDQEKVREVIFNIVDNAIKYTSNGGIEISCEITNSRIKLKIKDTGAGMSHEEISGIFKSFSRGKTGTKIWTEGTGLGLYVAKKFIEMHRGRIWAESEGANKGSTFYIELPIK